MRRLVLSVPIWLALGAAALAQGQAPASPPPPDATAPSPASPGANPVTSAQPGTVTGTGMSAPMSQRASNITAHDQFNSRIAPNLPSPPIGENGSPADYLRAAESALAAGRTGETQQSLEMAQTRLLDRSVPYGKTNVPSHNPAVDRISQALQALAAGDKARCMKLIQAAIPQAQAAH